LVITNYSLLSKSTNSFRIRKKFEMVFMIQYKKA